MAKKKGKPLTREDVLRLIEQNGGTAEGLDLSGKTFEAGIDLSELVLNGIILRGAYLLPDFDGGKFIGASLNETDLWASNLEGAYLDNASFKGANLYGANLKGAHLNGVCLEGADLWNANLKGAVLWRVRLEGVDFADTHLEGSWLDNVEFPRDAKLEGADWGKYIIGEEREGLFYPAADIYRHLKIWYMERGIYDIASEFFYREMEAKRKALKWWPNPFPRAWSKLISILCGYGEKPLRVIASAAVVVLGLALLYFAIGTLTHNTFLNSLYYSAVSYTALGYGSWAPEPTGWVKGLGAFEAFLGVFMMALFLITFIRKMTR